MAYTASREINSLECDMDDYNKDSGANAAVYTDVDQKISAQQDTFQLRVAKVRHDMTIQNQYMTHPRFSGGFAPFR